MIKYLRIHLLRHFDFIIAGRLLSVRGRQSQQTQTIGKILITNRGEKELWPANISFKAPRQINLLNQLVYGCLYASAKCKVSYKIRKSSSKLFAGNVISSLDEPIWIIQQKSLEENHPKTNQTD